MRYGCGKSSGRRAAWTANASDQPLDARCATVLDDKASSLKGFVVDCETVMGWASQCGRAEKVGT